LIQQNSAITETYAASVNGEHLSLLAVLMNFSWDVAAC
jgi:hypothetical protein